MQVGRCVFCSLGSCEVVGRARGSWEGGEEEEGRGDECCCSKKRGWRTVFRDGSCVRDAATKLWTLRLHPLAVRITLPAPKRWVKPSFVSTQFSTCTKKTRGKQCSDGLFFFLSFFYSYSLPRSFSPHLNKQISPGLEQMMQIMA